MSLASRRPWHSKREVGCGEDGNGEGSRPRESADGLWEARYWAGGKGSNVDASAHKEADKVVRDIAHSEEPRIAFATTNITVQEFFVQYDDAIRDTMTRRSLETYRDIALASASGARGQEERPGR